MPSTPHCKNRTITAAGTALGQELTARSFLGRSGSPVFLLSSFLCFRLTSSNLYRSQHQSDNCQEGSSHEILVQAQDLGRYRGKLPMPGRTSDVLNAYNVSTNTLIMTWEPLRARIKQSPNRIVLFGAYCSGSSL